MRWLVTVNVEMSCLQLSYVFVILSKHSLTCYRRQVVHLYVINNRNTKLQCTCMNNFEVYIKWNSLEGNIFYNVVASSPITIIVIYIPDLSLYFRPYCFSCQLSLLSTFFTAVERNMHNFACSLFSMCCHLIWLSTYSFLVFVSNWCFQQIVVMYKQLAFLVQLVKYIVA